MNYFSCCIIYLHLFWYDANRLLFCKPMCLQALSSPAVDSDLWPSNIEKATTVASVHSWFLDITIDISCWVRCQIRWQLCILFVFMYHLIGAYFTTWLMSEAWHSYRNNDNMTMKVISSKRRKKSSSLPELREGFIPPNNSFPVSTISLFVFVFEFSGLWQCLYLKQLEIVHFLSKSSC